jgi:hypothetical protein
MSGTVRRSWGAAEDDMLRDLFLVYGRSIEDIAPLVGRTLPAVRTRLSRLGMCTGMGGPMRDADRLAAAAAQRQRDATKHYVRCLGVGSLESEHRFVSPDPTRIRVCPTCRRRCEGLD